VVGPVGPWRPRRRRNEGAKRPRDDPLKAEVETVGYIYIESF
jgi:hypothetical protein